MGIRRLDDGAWEISGSPEFIKAWREAIDGYIETFIPSDSMYKERINHNEKLTKQAMNVSYNEELKEFLTPVQWRVYEYMKAHPGIRKQFQKADTSYPNYKDLTAEKLKRWANKLFDSNRLEKSIGVKEQINKINTLKFGIPNE